MNPEVPTTPKPKVGRARYRWVVETAIGIGLYLLYDELRSRAAGSGRVALRHAHDVVAVERALGLYQERGIQHAFIHWPAFMSTWNIYYGTIHFVMPVIALVTMWRRAPDRYVRWRNILLVMLVIGLIGFWTYPLMPPRLMPTRFGFVDTAARFFNFGPQQRVVLVRGVPSAAGRAAFGNLFAAMPSLHVGWATWSSLALFPIVRSRIARIGLVLYPMFTTFAIVVTANHWILDAIGGWFVLGISWLLVTGWARARRQA